MIRTLSNVLFSIEYVVKSIAGTRCLSWITLSTQSGFCDITSGLLNLIFPSFNPVQQKKMFVLSQAWVRWRAACAPSVASSSSPVRFPSWSLLSPYCTRSASTGNHKYKYKKIQMKIEVYQCTGGGCAEKKQTLKTEISPLKVIHVATQQYWHWPFNHTAIDHGKVEKR